MADQRDKVALELGQIETLLRQCDDADKRISEAADERLSAIDRELAEIKPIVMTDESLSERYQALVLERGRLSAMQRRAIGS